jgi:hypothetical protein
MEVVLKFAPRAADSSWLPRDTRICAQHLCADSVPSCPSIHLISERAVLAARPTSPPLSRCISLHSRSYAVRFRAARRCRRRGDLLHQHPRCDSSHASAPPLACRPSRAGAAHSCRITPTALPQITKIPYTRTSRLPETARLTRPAPLPIRTSYRSGKTSFHYRRSC